MHLVHLSWRLATIQSSTDLCQGPSASHWHSGTLGKARATLSISAHRDRGEDTPTTLPLDCCCSPALGKEHPKEC